MAWLCAGFYGLLFSQIPSRFIPPWFFPHSDERYIAVGWAVFAVVCPVYSAVQAAISAKARAPRLSGAKFWKNVGSAGGIGFGFVVILRSLWWILNYIGSRPSLA